jgi:hypothetical protein
MVGAPEQEILQEITTLSEDLDSIEPSGFGQNC